MIPNNILDNLNKIANIDFDMESIPYLSVQSEKTGQGRTFSISTAKVPRINGLFDRIRNFFLELFGQIPKKDVDDLKDVKKFFKSVLRLELSDEAKQTIRPIIAHCFESMERIYNLLRRDNSIEAMAAKNDLLEAVSVAVMEGGLNDKFNLDVQRIAADAVKPFSEKMKEKHIPIIKMHEVETVTALIKRKFPERTPTLHELQTDPDLKYYLHIENVAMGSIALLMYKKRFWGKLLNNEFISGIVTKWMERTTKKILKPGKKRTETLLKFFKKLHINLATEIDGQLYSYREMFQKSFRKEVSCDEAFQRGLNASSSKRLFSDVKSEPALGLPVICNAFCRLRVLEIPENSVKTRFSIEGKKLNNNDPSGFTIQNLFGNENDVNTKFNNQFGSAVPYSEADAEYLYQCCLTNAVNRKKATIVIQRLAPCDIHHYVESVGGRVLNREEACRKLKELINQGSDEQEKRQLEILANYFHEKDPSKGVVEVQGTRMSVSTLATKYQSPLSQNDRKIMLVEHEDGNFSISVFIGAVSVNNVKVTAQPGEIQMGADVGSMGFGNDENGREDWKKMATKNDSIRVRANSEEQVDLGEERGSFALGGSTVVSILFNFKPIKKVAEATSALKYTDCNQTIRNIEIESKMGDLIGYLVP